MSSAPPSVPEKVLLFGLAATGQAVAAALLAHGHEVVLADDAERLPRLDILAAATRTASELVVHTAPSEDELRCLIAGVDAVAPSPGVPAHHGAYRLAEQLGRPIVGDFDLAARWDDRPIAAVTGTNGKTTVTVLAAAMLNASGIETVVAGNTGLPLVAAIDRYRSAEVFVVEASSFRLACVHRFAPRVGVWLNLAPDHLDWHGNMSAYEAAKARIWANPCVAVLPQGDTAIAAHVPPGERCVTFAPSHGCGAADIAVVDGQLCAFGRPILAVADMAQRRPHDVANAAAAAAIALEMGADDAAIASELAHFEGLPHRLAKVATVNGVTFYDDSKATTPHAVVAGLAGFEKAVLIAGGRNKGISLEPLAVLAPNLRAVVALGDAADEIEAVFRGRSQIARADSMAKAVELAFALSEPGTDVVLSPACASFDWYQDYEERGDDFAAEVARLAKDVGTVRDVNTVNNVGTVNNE